ncbi:ATP-grasp domain-containing protein [Sphingobacterium corticibacter]|uniref:Glutathione synthetase n=1 Tax=Sphingobacterium corticibacter TaxID=2171749 RepID=A0A2T8HFW6_9SPHI|nr:glutathione synthase [Sphingobacterium corticibacter]PVH24304.1 glutathione synthetase [Sphingobacterium corticibacter]
MKIAFVINQTHKEEAYYTTTSLALKALERGHEVFYIGLADFYYDPEVVVGAHARQVSPHESIQTESDFIHVVRETEKSLVNLKQIDVLWLRFDAADEMISRPWAAAAGLQFAELAQQQGVFVINNPEALTRASNKLYLENFDESIRPKTIVTRNYADVQNFFDKNEEKIILKPLKGSGGKNVFLINKESAQNLKQTVEAIARDGYIIAQEYLPEASKGDLRFFLLDGKPIEINGQYAAVRRVQPENEIRSNVHQGATMHAAEIDENTLKVVKLVADQLVKDGMYLVGLDIVGSKIMEINVFSPGALQQASELTGQDFISVIIKDIEHKIHDRKK